MATDTRSPEAAPRPLRLFVAVNLGSDVIASLEPIQKRLRREIGEAADVRWVRPDRSHLTLVFIGHVPVAEAERARVALEPPLAVPALRLRFGGLETLPPRGVPRVLCLGVRGDVDALAALRTAVVERLTAGDIAFDRKPFHPHLTLGRCRRASRALTMRLARLAGEEPFHAGCCVVSHVTLYESRLGPDGPHYAVVARTPLAPASPS